MTGCGSGYPQAESYREEEQMPWVRRHRRNAPYSWFRTTTVRSHYRRPPGGVWIPVLVAIAVIVLLIALF
ncbi:hypothetical protein GCM10027200_01000 [Lentzea nigeriaca]